MWPIFHVAWQALLGCCWLCLGNGHCFKILCDEGKRFGEKQLFRAGWLGIYRLQYRWTMDSSSQKYEETGPMYQKFNKRRNKLINLWSIHYARLTVRMHLAPSTSPSIINTFNLLPKQKSHPNSDD